MAIEAPEPPGPATPRLVKRAVELVGARDSVSRKASTRRAFPVDEAKALGSHINTEEPVKVLIRP